MNQITSYSPIESITIAGDTIPARGLTVVVGPNSSGKTLLLRDICTIAIGGSSFNVLSSSNLEAPSDSDSLLDSLFRAGLILPVGPSQFIVALSSPGFPEKNRDTFSNSDFKQAVLAWRQNGNSHTFLSQYSPILLSRMLLDHRRDYYTTASRISYSQLCSHDLHKLFKDKPAQTRLESITQQAFGKCVWLDQLTQGTAFELRVSENGPPTSDIRLDAVACDAYPRLADEGDGIKSFVTIAITLLVGTRPVIVIDEPELYLHPPQCYLIGNLIGELGSSPNRNVFVATHSSDVLRGIIDKARDYTSILRLECRNRQFSARHCPNRTLTSLLRPPNIRAENVLDGLFSRSVVAVEAEGDRLVYQRATELVEQYSHDVHFVPCGGNGIIPDVVQFYKSLNVRVAAIVDLDTITDDGLLQKFLASFVDDDNLRKECRTAASVITAASRAAIATFSWEPIISGLERLRLLASKSPPPASDETDIIRSLKQLRDEIKDSKRLRKGGIEAFRPTPNTDEMNHPDAPLYNAFMALIDTCNPNGLFFVPVGTLEAWMTDEVNPDIRGKVNRVNEVVRLLRENPTRPDRDLIRFIEHVLKFFSPSSRTS